MKRSITFCLVGALVLSHFPMAASAAFRSRKSFRAPTRSVSRTVRPRTVPQRRVLPQRRVSRIVPRRPVTRVPSRPRLPQVQTRRPITRVTRPIRNTLPKFPTRPVRGTQPKVTFPKQRLPKSSVLPGVKFPPVKTRPGVGRGPKIPGRPVIPFPRPGVRPGVKFPPVKPRPGIGIGPKIPTRPGVRPGKTPRPSIIDALPPRGTSPITPRPGISPITKRPIKDLRPGRPIKDLVPPGPRPVKDITPGKLPVKDIKNPIGPIKDRQPIPPRGPIQDPKKIENGGRNPIDGIRPIDGLRPADGVRPIDGLPDRNPPRGDGNNGNDDGRGYPIGGYDEDGNSVGGQQDDYWAPNPEGEQVKVDEVFEDQDIYLENPAPWDDPTDPFWQGDKPYDWKGEWPDVPPPAGGDPGNGGKIPPDLGEVPPDPGGKNPPDGTIPPDNGGTPPPPGDYPPPDDGVILPPPPIGPPCGGVIIPPIFPPGGGGCPPIGGGCPPIGGGCPPIGGGCPPIGGDLPPMGGGCELPPPPCTIDLGTGMEVPPPADVAPQPQPQGEELLTLFVGKPAVLPARLPNDARAILLVNGLALPMKTTGQTENGFGVEVPTMGLAKPMMVEVEVTSADGQSFGKLRAQLVMPRD